MKLSFASLFAAGVLLFGGGAAAQAPDTDMGARCRGLQGPGGGIVEADFASIPEAPTTVYRARVGDARGDVPARCVVDGNIGGGGTVGFRLELPLAGWNGRFIELGCGSTCGIYFPDNLNTPQACDATTSRGYACIIADSGHKGADGKWAYNNLQAILDFGRRATHVAALAGKAITGRFYGSGPKYSYFMGCSRGGQQAMSQAQTYPWDFDGIIAGSTGLDIFNGGFGAALWVYDATHDDAGRPLLTAQDLAMVQKAALSLCDKDDGLVDGLVADPRTCRFDVRKLACPAAKTPACLTPVQVEAMERAYAGPDIKGLEWLGELPLSDYLQDPITPSTQVELYRYMFFTPAPGPAWTLKDLDWANDFKRGATVSSLYTIANPDLRRFKATGAKLMQYVGWSDHANRPLEMIDYYRTVERVMGGRAQTQDFYRLYLLPGVEHCGGGPGADTVDYLGHMEAWVEKGQAPEMMVASKLKTRGGPGSTRPASIDPQNVQFSRPVYPYPKQARYRGRGDPNSAASFGVFEPKE